MKNELDGPKCTLYCSVGKMKHITNTGRIILSHVLHHPGLFASVSECCVYRYQGFRNTNTASRERGRGGDVNVNKERLTTQRAIY